MESELYGVFSNTCGIASTNKQNPKRQIKRKHRINFETVFSQTIIKLLD